MPTEVLMPRLSDDVEDGVLVTWFVEPGADVAPGDLVAEIQVEKVGQEVYAPVGGRIVDLRLAPGETAAQGAVIALIGAPGEASPAPAATPPARPPVPAPAPAPTGGAASPTATGGATSPAARRVARELGVDLSGVAGSGPGGRIVEDDVRRAAGPAAPAVPIPGQLLPPARRVLADRLRSWQAATAPLTLTAEADVTVLAGTFPSGPPGAAGSYVAAVVRACALALRDHPGLGSRWVDGRLIAPVDIDIGVAVALEGSLVVPVVRRADTKSAGAIRREVAELAGRARAGTLTVPEMHDAVFTVTNLGAYDIDAFTPLLDPPQTAILGLGRARPRPAVVDGRLEPRTLMVLSLTVDHQVTDGVPAAAFLSDVIGQLENPPSLA